MAGITDLRKGFVGLAALVQQRRGDLVKLLWLDDQGLVVHAKRLERGQFICPATAEGVAVLTRQILLFDDPDLFFEHVPPPALNTREDLAVTATSGRTVSDVPHS
ncbi:IS66 family insertion sequence element accessory protein TnpB [Sphingomonas sp. PB2P19]|uniref:IS66 family insertion sequence element accessory protein TnpB n=1 Tax=Sphingomonas rhamnosi TaxID=3096156 RepID=UPI002FCA271F